jgi:DNA-binding FrmR family transcriptional regulator
MNRDNEKLMIAMKKAKTSLDKNLKMIESGRYCIDVIQQNLAVIGLLRSANMELLAGHINTCVKNAARKGGKELDEKMVELIKVLKIAQTK